jgi:hypothetical protein
MQHLIKLNISIDKADFRAYRTIVLQSPTAKRLTSGKFFEKNLRNKTPFTDFSSLEKDGVDNCCKYIIKSVSSGSNSETANCKKNGKINACNRPKSKFRPVKWDGLA